MRSLIEFDICDWLFLREINLECKLELEKTWKQLAIIQIAEFHTNCRPLRSADETLCNLLAVETQHENVILSFTKSIRRTVDVESIKYMNTSSYSGSGLSGLYPTNIIIKTIFMTFH